MRSGEVDGYDGIFLSPHKFLGGAGSPGILLMSKALYQLGSSAPSTCGGGTVNYVSELTLAQILTQINVST
jgi:selenocysteine lyase/cysteine desulfurase